MMFLCKFTVSFLIKFLKTKSVYHVVKKDNFFLAALCQVGDLAHRFANFIGTMRIYFCLYGFVQGPNMQIRALFNNVLGNTTHFNA